jgi:membrane protein implicated in regulation of membrane protease activity
MEYLGTGKLFWFVMGFVLLIMEILTPGVFFLFFGVGAWVVLLILAFLPLATWLQWVVFIVTSIFFLIFLREHVVKLFAQKSAPKTDSLSEPMVSERYLGKDVDVITDIVPGRTGTVEFNGTHWQGKSDTPITKGSRARIIKMDELTLVLEPLEGTESTISSENTNNPSNLSNSPKN